MGKSDINATPIGKFGKYGLIDLLTKNAGQANKSTHSAVGDDSAVIDSGGSFTLVTTDMLLEGIHFNLIYTPLKHLGYKAVIRAISDIYAMNGRPGQLLAAIGISSRFSVEQVSELYEGVYLACKKYSVDKTCAPWAASHSGVLSIFSFLAFRPSVNT